MAAGTGERTMIRETLKADLPARAVSVGRGLVRVPEDGDYTFHLQTKGRAVVRLHQALLFDADHGYGGEALQTTLPLKAGDHPLTIHVLADDEKPALALKWERDGLLDSIPAENLFHEDS